MVRFRKVASGCEQKSMNQNRHPEGEKKTALIVKMVLLFLFLSVVVYLSFRIGPGITRLVRQPQKFREFLDSYGSASALIFIAFQAIQVIVAVIPGEIVQIAGGYAFGTVLGTLYSVLGIFVGSLIVFFTTRLLGFSLVKTFVPQKKIERFAFLINSPKSEIAMFTLFLIPGVPKDTLVYIAGLTPMKPFRFLLIATIARFPGLLGSAYIGSNLQKKHYLPVTVISVAALVLFVIGLLSKDKIIDKIHNLRHRGADSGSD